MIRLFIQTLKRCLKMPEVVPKPPRLAWNSVEPNDVFNVKGITTKGDAAMETKRVAAIALIGVLAVVGLVGSLTACGSEAPTEEVIPMQPAEQPQPQVTEPTPLPIDKVTPEPIHEGIVMIEMRVGDTHTVALESNPTTGYGWEIGLEFNGECLELVEQSFEPDSDLVGAPGRELFTFRALAFGMVEFSFNYKRPGEDEILKTGRYTFNIGMPATLADEITEGEAREIAVDSECGKAGLLKENALYNDWTGTWWIDLDAQKEGCNPACVVWVATKRAEINWRCMGVPPPTDEMITPATPTTTATPTDASEKPVAKEVKIGLVLSEKQRAASPDVASSDLTNLVSGNSAFAFDLYEALSEKDGNLFYSPYSISLALAMTYAGARSETEQQMTDTIHFILPQDRLHAAFNRLDLKLAARGKGVAGQDEKGFRLNIVNAIWGQEDYKFLAEFLDVLAENYGTGLRLLDFIMAPEESRIAINDWVSEQTEGRIEDLIPQGVIDALTRLVLTNAIYFNAAWAYPFNEDMTDDGTFHLLDGDATTVPMMKKTEFFGYAEGNGYQAVELPYDGHELSMVILLPNAGQFETFEAALDTDRVDAIAKGLAHKQVDLTIPKFEYESEFSLANTLAAMGMPVAFSREADFSGMTGNRDLFIAEILHKSFVSVDEAGTEAAAATAVVMRLTAAPEPPLEVTVDRPFVFFIRDIETGAILFVGRVLDPSS